MNYTRPSVRIDQMYCLIVSHRLDIVTAYIHVRYNIELHLLFLNWRLSAKGEIRYFLIQRMQIVYPAIRRMNKNNKKKNN